MRILLPLAAIVVGTGVMAASPGVSNGGARTGADDAQRIICKHEKSSTSRVPKKTCMTKAEREAITERTRREAAEAINSPQINPKSE